MYIFIHLGFFLKPIMLGYSYFNRQYLRNCCDFSAARYCAPLVTPLADCTCCQLFTTTSCKPRLWTCFSNASVCCVVESTS